MDNLEEVFNHYQIPINGSTFHLCRDIMKAVEEGRFFTDEDLLLDDSSYQSAKMLRQLMKLDKERHDLTLIVKGVQEQYSSSIVIDSLKETLIDNLSKVIEKHKGVKRNGVDIEDYMLLSIGYGGGYTGRSFLIPCKNIMEVNENGFSKEELDLIIDYWDKELNPHLQSLLGRIQYDKLNEGKDKVKRRQMFGYYANMLLYNINEVDKTDIRITDKYCFICDFLQFAGILNCMGVKYLDDIPIMAEEGDIRKHKYKLVDKWIKSL